MYVREIDDQILTLQVSGKLWMRSLVMRDVETGSEWAHLLGRSMEGKLKGKTLRPLITDMVTWQRWKQRYPETTVLDMSRTAEVFRKDFYRDRSRFVFGFVVAGNAYALPMNAMSTAGVHNFELQDQAFVATFDDVGAATYLFSAQHEDRILHFQRVDAETMHDLETGSVWNQTSGRAIAGDLVGVQLEPQVGIMSFKTAWRNFHPDSKPVDF